MGRKTKTQQEKTAETPKTTTSSTGIESLSNSDSRKSIVNERENAKPDKQSPKEVQRPDIPDTEEAATAIQTPPLIVFKANRPLHEKEYEELERRVHKESERTGINIVLAPCSVEVIVNNGH